jgi:hypothetical protein
MKRSASSMLSVLLAAVCVHAGDSGTGRFMAGWDDGPSVKVKGFQSYWFGLYAAINQNMSVSDYENKFPDYANVSAPPKEQSGENKDHSHDYRFILSVERDCRVHKYMLLNPFVSAGYVNSRYRSDMSTLLEYPGLNKQESQTLSLATGVMPTVEVWNHLRISLRFSLQVSRNWGESRSIYSQSGSAELYHQNNEFESTQFSYTGNAVLNYSQLILHWIF